MKCFCHWNELTQSQQASIKLEKPGIDWSKFWWRASKYGWEQTQYR